MQTIFSYHNIPEVCDCRFFPLSVILHYEKNVEKIEV